MDGRPMSLGVGNRVAAVGVDRKSDDGDEAQGGLHRDQLKRLSRFQSLVLRYLGLEFPRCYPDIG